MANTKKEPKAERYAAALKELFQAADSYIEGNQPSEIRLMLAAAEYGKIKREDK